MGFWQRPLPSPKVFFQILKVKWGEVGTNSLAYPPLALGSVQATGEAEPVAVMFSSDPPVGKMCQPAVSLPPPRLLTAPVSQKAGLGTCSPGWSPISLTIKAFPGLSQILDVRQVGTSGLQ